MRIYEHGQDIYLTMSYRLAKTSVYPGAYVKQENGRWGQTPVDLPMPSDLVLAGRGGFGTVYRCNIPGNELHKSCIKVPNSRMYTYIDVNYAQAIPSLEIKPSGKFWKETSSDQRVCDEIRMWEKVLECPLLFNSHETGGPVNVSDELTCSQITTEQAEWTGRRGFHHILPIYYSDLKYQYIVFPI